MSTPSDTPEIRPTLEDVMTRLGRDRSRLREVWRNVPEEHRKALLDAMLEQRDTQVWLATEVPLRVVAQAEALETP